ncbi:MAG: hypothetical protein HY398_01900 [Candidatus Doudnabacteria bacterium]|nr:hypothetical protein [Candidatus Doudnabacteria bacterium]
MNVIKKNQKIIALLLDGKYKRGTHGVTPRHLPLQVVSLNHPKGKFWPAHIHRPKKRITRELREVFFVTRGRARVEILFKNKVYKSFVLREGQGIMLLDGAIRIKALAPLMALEFKNGPFMEDKHVFNAQPE